MNDKQIKKILKKEKNNAEKLIEYMHFLSIEDSNYDQTLINTCIEYLNNLNISNDILDTKLQKYTNIYTNSRDIIYQKALNSNFLRYYIKDLNKKIKFIAMSQNQTKKLLAAKIVDIIHQASCLAFKNLFKEKYFEFFVELAEKDLKDEFDQCVEREIIPFIIDKDVIMDSKYNDFAILFDHAFASWMLEYHKSKPNLKLLTEYKEKINQIIEMDFSKIKELVDLEKKEVDTKKDPIEFKKVDDILDETTLDALNDFKINLKDNYYEKNIYDNIIDTLHTDEVIDKLCESKYFKNIDKRSKKSYLQYFQYGEYNYVDEYADHMFPIIVAFQIDKSNNQESFFLSSIRKYFKSEITLKCQNDGLNGKMAQQVVSFEYALTFINLLAYSLQYSKYGNNNMIVEQFKDILDNNQKCQKAYYDLKNNFQKEFHLRISFTPHTLFNNQIIAAVLTELEDASIARKVKKILINDDEVGFLNKPTNKTSLNDELIRLNKEQLRLYFTEDNSNLVNYLHEFAVVFILSFIKDHEYIAGNTAFVRFAIDEINYCDKDYLFTPVIYQEALDFDQNPFKTKQEFNHLKRIAKKLDNLINQIDDNNLIIKQYYLAMLAKSKDTHYYNDISNLKLLFTKHKSELIFIIYNYDNENLKFFKQPLKQQLDYLLQCCIYLNFIDEIDHSEELFTNVTEIKNTHDEPNLKAEIKKLKQQLNDKDKQIQTLESSNILLKQTSQESLNKEAAKINSSYQKEISTLNKELHEKDLQIEILKENQTELYKLRELMFSIQNQNNDFNVNEAVDLSEILTNKNVLLVGGHIKLIDKLKAKYPTLKSIGNDQAINESLVANCDHIFIFYNFLNHSAYHKVMNVVSKTDIKWDYISFTNLEKVEAYLISKLT